MRETAAHRYPIAREPLGGYAKDPATSPPPTRSPPSRPPTSVRPEDITYDRLFDYYADTETWAPRMPGASSSTTTSRPPTAPASCRAPAYGEDDQRVTNAAGIPTILSDDGGVPAERHDVPAAVMDANRR
ncbi:hypothetical protein [Microbacterium sp.]|uniref:hypothetical protein n=1 Tax=Microbacterium sp. TaxID=51671 RepID=UPI003A94E7F1